MARRAPQELGRGRDLRRGPLAALAPACRLLCLLCLASALFVSEPPSLLCLISLLLVLLYLEGLDPRALAGELPALALLSIFTLALESLDLDSGLALDPQGPLRALPWILRFFSAFLLGRLFYRSTPSSELREAAEALGGWLPARLGSDLALALSLVLGFVPNIVYAYRLSREAGEARGLHRGSGPGLRLRVAEALLRRLMLDALLLPEILVARGWTGRAQTRPRPWKLPSYASLGACVLLALLALLGPI